MAYLRCLSFEWIFRLRILILVIGRICNFFVDRCFWLPFPLLRPFLTPYSITYLDCVGHLLQFFILFSTLLSVPYFQLNDILFYFCSFVLLLLFSICIYLHVFIISIIWIYYRAVSSTFYLPVLFGASQLSELSRRVLTFHRSL